ncbi:ABC transporter ATP-binding protein [Methanosarcina sp.]|uniref:ABC transporter ATP-binding protein n=1 Tax=Methanosarcina sp. TaxID=2213 RepID=UPI0029895D0D|nr:ABC transporter ATP-binding protein [Methanosarcina sp.]MDW5551471.1 ABC transporter ATP-binding protein [Methanosarcina sp.]MDW5554385.1 ABC transporter ATP-binding protein [Methanosarcina sp.]MDW5560630.1 ABC transporter ATP-binding protein [Methanosarcina sp.]
MLDTIIELRNVTKVYTLGSNQIYALKQVSLLIKKGDFVTIMGPSGSGKSTLLNLIGCLDLPSEGTIRISGTDISILNDDDLTAIRRNSIGFIFQQFNLIQTLTAIENVEMPMIFNRMSAAARRERAFVLLERANLELKYADHKPSELSGGQQQRMAIARALANNPPVILADEPTGNLDTSTGTSVMELLSDLNANGTTVIVVTHDESLKRYSRTIIKLRDGQICPG